MDPNDVDNMDFPLPTEAPVDIYQQRQLQEQQLLQHLESIGYKRYDAFHLTSIFLFQAINLNNVDGFVSTLFTLTVQRV
jgi:hypothetical protein